MNGAPPRVVIEAAIFLAVCMVALGSFGYAILKWRAGTETKQLPVWRQIATIVAFVAVGTQVGVFAAFWIWPQIGRDYVTFGQWARWVLPPFLVAFPCGLAGRGAIRWLLLLASVLLFGICFLIVLSA